MTVMKVEKEKVAGITVDGLTGENEEARNAAADIAAEAVSSLHSTDASYDEPGFLDKVSYVMDSNIKVRHVVKAIGVGLVVVGVAEIAGRYTDKVPCFGILKRKPLLPGGGTKK